MTAFASLDRIAAECFGYADRSPAPVEPFPVAEGGSKGSKGSLGVGGNGSLGVVSDAGSGNGSMGVVSEDERTAARAAALGVGGPLRTPFACLFATCDDRASLRPTKAGYWKYRCSCLGRDVGLAEVYGLLAYERVGLLLRKGRLRRLSDSECARWGDRLDADAGLSDREPVAVVVPDGAPPSAVRVARGMGLLVGLRDPDRPAKDGRRWTLATPFVFARDFARAYCGLTEEEARYGVVALRRAGVIEPAGRSGPAILWRLVAAAAPPPPPSGGGGAPPVEPPPPALGPPEEPDGEDPEEVVARLREEFGAREVRPAPEPVVTAYPPPADCWRDAHRAAGLDWRGAGDGPTVCGVCHPPPARDDFEFFRVAEVGP